MLPMADTIHGEELEKKNGESLKKKKNISIMLKVKAQFLCLIYWQVHQKEKQRIG